MYYNILHLMAQRWLGIQIISGHIQLCVFALFQVGSKVVVGKRRVNTSCSISTAWMPTFRCEISLGNGKELKTLDMSTSYGKQNLNISASLNIVDKVQHLFKPQKGDLRLPEALHHFLNNDIYFW